jgi:hypothetical protein
MGCARPSTRQGVHQQHCKDSSILALRTFSTIASALCFLKRPSCCTLRLSMYRPSLFFRLASKFGAMVIPSCTLLLTTSTTICANQLMRTVPAHHEHWCLVASCAVRYLTMQCTRILWTQISLRRPSTLVPVSDGTIRVYWHSGRRCSTARLPAAFQEPAAAQIMHVLEHFLLMGGGSHCCSSSAAAAGVNVDVAGCERSQAIPIMGWRQACCRTIISVYGGFHVLALRCCPSCACAGEQAPSCPRARWSTWHRGKQQAADTKAFAYTASCHDLKVQRLA